ncbi:MAG: DUF4340 domain-containing protein [Ruminococcus sp.]|nr:DUF4340 domain-containing protein [Ruminococcus sp.]
MNGKIQGIIVCGVLAASLAGVMVFLNATSPDKDSSSAADAASQALADSGENTKVVLIDKGADQVSGVKVKNQYGGFTLAKPVSGKTTWTIEELGSLNQNSTLQSGLADVCGVLEARKLVEENAEDLAKYGLAEPAASAEITYADGSTLTLEVGDVMPEERYRYVRLGDSNNVYMVMGSRVKYFTDPANAYADLNLIIKPSDQDWPEYGTETVTRRDWDYDVVFENDPKEIQGMISSQVISSPIFSYLNITSSSDVTHGMWGLKAAECSVIDPTEEDYERLGLNDPVCVVKLKGDEYDYTLTVGNKAEYDEEEEAAGAEGYYCTLEGQSGQDAIYTISSGNLPWVSFKIEDVISSIMLSNYIVDIDTLTVENGGKSHQYKVTSDGNSEDLMAEGGSANVTSVTSGGKDIDIANFKTLFQYIMTCPTGELCFDEPQGDWEVRIEQKLIDGSSDVVEIYKDTARRYIVKLNGKPSFRIQSTWVDNLLKNVENLDNGKEVVDTY